MLDHLTIGLPHSAIAYLDGGTGSMILQIAMAGLLSAGYVIKTRWQHFKSFFVRKSDRQDG